MAQPNATDKVRLNLDLQPEVRERLDSLQKTTQAASLTEVIRRALALYNLVIDHQSNGGKLVLKNSDGTQETITLL